MDVPFTASRDLPPYRGILAVDAKGFTDRPGMLHQPISGLIPQIVGKVFHEIGKADVWDDPIFFGSGGDGFAMGVPTRVLPFLIHPFLPALQRALAVQNATARTPMQLRVSLHVGPLPATDDPYEGGNGPARNETHRLLDSEPVRRELAGASPEVTFVAAILSERIHQDVVLQGYAGVHPDRLTEVEAEVKTFKQRAWLYVPEPSGTLRADRIEPPAAAAPVARAADPAVPGLRVRKNTGQIAGTVQGDMNQGWRPGR